MTLGDVLRSVGCGLGYALALVGWLFYASERAERRRQREIADRAGR